jgi:hypothetical protein
MRAHAAITVSGPRDEIQRRWTEAEHRHSDASDATVTFRDAPGDRGTEIHADLGSGGPRTSAALARVKDELRRFKQVIETGEVSRSDAVPDGERVQRKLRSRPAQPIADDELAAVVGGR